MLGTLSYYNPVDGQADPRTVVGVFATSPIDKRSLIMGSSDGSVFRTTGPLNGEGIQWFEIGGTGAGLGGLPNSRVTALQFGAPASYPTTVPANHIYAGFANGQIFVTFVGGGGNWFNISAGLDGSPIRSIVTNPKAGSREAYAVTEQGVYWMANSQTPTAWVKLNDTAGMDTLFNKERAIFHNSNDTTISLKNNQLTSLVADWRYAVPDNLSDPTGPSHPVLYVSGYGGVFRSYDKGITWRYFPSVDEGAPEDMGYLPSVQVMDLDLALGDVNVNSGFTDPSAGLNLLMATTWGRGIFAIRLDHAPYQQFLVQPNSGPRVQPPVTTVQANFGSQLVGLDVVFTGAVDPLSVQAGDFVVTGPLGSITVTSVQDITPPPGTGQANLHNRWRVNFAPQTVAGNYSITVGVDIRDFAGNQMNQNLNNINGEIPQDRYFQSLFFTPNTNPTISDIPNQRTNPNTATGAISFTVGDAESGPNPLIVTATSSNATLVPNTAFNIMLGGSGADRTITLVPASGQRGSTIITVRVTDPQGLFTEDQFTLFVNFRPAIADISDQTMSHSEVRTINVPNNILVNDGDGDSINLTNQVFDFVASRAFELDQQFQLFFTGSFSQNAAGMNEKWIRSGLPAPNNFWYIIKPDGAFLRWDGSGLLASDFILVETLTPAYWSDPALLYNAIAPAPLSGWIITPNVPALQPPPINGPLVIDPPDDFSGKVRIVLSSTDNIETATETFNVTVTNAAPTINVIADQSIPHTTDFLDVNINGLGDADTNDIVTLSADIFIHDLKGLAYRLDQEFRLFFTGSFSQNSAGMNEKWIRSELPAPNNFWYIIKPDGSFHRWNGGSSFTLVATLDNSYWVDPSKLYNAPLPDSGSANLAAPTFTPPGVPPGTSSVLRLNPNANFAGDLLIRVNATDGILTTSRFFKFSVTNALPTLNAIGDVTISHTQDTQIVNLSGIGDVDGDPVNLSAKYYLNDFVGKAYRLDQDFQLFFTGNYSQNSSGFNEKWMRSGLPAPNNFWYTIRPDGTFHRWNGGSSFTLVETLDNSFWVDPTKIHDAPEPTDQTAAFEEAATTFVPNNIVSPGGNATSTMTVNPTDTLGGQFLVRVAANDGLQSIFRFFRFTITNAAPTLNAIANQTMPHTQDTLNVGLSGISDADLGEAVNLSAKYYAGTLAATAFRLDSEFQLFFTGNFSQNSAGINEKWMRSALAPTNFWYIIKPDGAFLQWDGSGSLASDFLFVAGLDNSFWVDPSKIFNAPEPADITAAFEEAATTFVPNNIVSQAPVGSTMTINPNDNQAGVFLVRVAASDGITPTHRFFQLTINNSLPTMNAIADQSVNHTGFTDVTVGGITDADGDTIGLSAVAYQFTLGALAYRLDSELGLFFTGNFSQNSSGLNEKWLRAANDGNAWYIIEPNGKFSKWNGGSSFTQTALLDNTFWADPSLLYDAQTPAPFAMDQLFFNPASVPPGNSSSLTLDPPNTFVGDLLIEARANDGTTNGLTKRFFKLTSINTPPVLPFIANQTMTAPQTQLDVNLNGSDADNDTLVYTVTTASGDGLASDAFALDQQYQFFEVANNPRWFFNFYGGQEKWFRSAVDQQWYAIFPNGTVRQFLASNPLGGPIIATLSSTYYNDPTLLVNAQAPVNPPVTTTLLDNPGTPDTNDRILRLTITDPNFFGTFRVRVSVTDGFDTVMREFLVTRS
ncbi:MAG: hypothetical protein L0Y70_19170 [Gemmataceae bacterium]|nr:hypothetical protein [Gemmataceae bacterium]